jgi:hypothetical protein
VIEQAIADGLSFLSNARNADGSWGYQRGAAGQLEPTILCGATGLEIAGDWIRAQPRAWPSLLLPAAIADRDPSLASETADWILTQQSVSVDLTKEFDGTIPAWSWVEGTAAWVEPTCYAILSLVRTRKGAQRIADGRRLLRDRQCRDGGWNYGNPRMLGTELQGQAAPTGWALLALERSDPAVPTGLASLASAKAEPSTLALSLAVLASVWHRHDPGDFTALLAPRIGAEGARGRIDWTALAVIALQSAASQHVVFELPDPA